MLKDIKIADIVVGSRHHHEAERHPAEE